MSYIKATIDYEAQNSPNDLESRRRTHKDTETFPDRESALEWIKNQTGVEKLKASGKPFYRDITNPTDGEVVETVQVGKIYSYWASQYDRSRGKINYWETAWVELKEVEETTLDIDKAVGDTK